MQRTKLIVFLFFTCLGFVYSQNKNEHYKSKDFLVGQTYLIFENDTYLYKKASHDSKIIKALKAGDQIEIEEFTSVVSGQGSNKGVYLKVKTEDNKRGYLSSTDLSLGYFEINSEVSILYQKQRHVEETLLHFNKVSKGRETKDLGAVSFQKSSFTIHFDDNKGLPRIDHVIAIHFNNNSCDSAPSIKYLSLDLTNNELLQFAFLKNYCNDNKTSTLQKILFPNDIDGVKDALVYYSSKKVLFGDKYQEYKTYIYTKVYKWASGGTIEPIYEYYW